MTNMTPQTKVLFELHLEATSEREAQTFTEEKTLGQLGYTQAYLDGLTESNKWRVESYLNDSLGEWQHNYFTSRWEVVEEDQKYNIILGE